MQICQLLPVFQPKKVFLKDLEAIFFNVIVKKDCTPISESLWESKSLISMSTS